MERKEGWGKIELDAGSNRLEVEVGFSRIWKLGNDSSNILEVDAYMGGDLSNMSEVEDDMDVGGMSRGRCCCITGGEFVSRGLVK